MSIFYKTHGLNFEDKVSLIDDAFFVATNWRVDILDCSKSWRRQKIEMSFDEIMQKFSPKCHFTVCIRNDFDETYGEVTFSTMDSVSYFLWVYLDVELLLDIIQKYKLARSTRERSL